MSAKSSVDTSQVSLLSSSIRLLTDSHFLSCFLQSLPFAFTLFRPFDLFFTEARIIHLIKLQYYISASRCHYLRVKKYPPAPRVVFYQLFYSSLAFVFFGTSHGVRSLCAP